MNLVHVSGFIPTQRDRQPAHGLQAMIETLAAYISTHIDELSAPHWHQVRVAHRAMVKHAGACQPPYAGMHASGQFLRDAGFVAKPALSGVILTAHEHGGAVPPEEGARRVFTALRDLLAPGAKALIVDTVTHTTTELLLDGDRQVFVVRGEIVWDTSSQRSY